MSYPNYVQRMLDRAEEMIINGDDPTAAAALCYEVLALFPDHVEAAELVYKAMCNPRLIRDMRRAIEHHIDEWDDRPWQERRRLALSYRFVSCWNQKYASYLMGDTVMWPEDVHEMAEEGRQQLLQDSLLDQSRGAELAWGIFAEAIRRTHDPGKMLLSAGCLYADQGYFAEAIDMLQRALAQGMLAQQEVSQLLAEVRWWCDNQERIPWLPPMGDGSASRFQRMIARIDPKLTRLDTVSGSMVDHVPPNLDKLPADFMLPTPLSPDLTAKIESALGSPSPASLSGPVDWRYLDRLEAGDVDISRLPEWAQYLLLELDSPEQETLVLQYILSHLANPPTDEEEIA